MSRRTPPFTSLALCLFALSLLGGCVQRTLQVTSEPSGALVYLNGEEVGRTPMRKTFVWYGTYDVELRKEGYETKVTQAKVWAPWWQIPPIDLFAELVPLPLQDNHAVSYTLEPVSAEQVDPQRVIDRAVQLRGRLRSSEHTRQPAAATRPATTQSTD
jgi:hypothetical protein